MSILEEELISYLHLNFFFLFFVFFIFYGKIMSIVSLFFQVFDFSLLLPFFKSVLMESLYCFLARNTSWKTLWMGRLCQGKRVLHLQLGNFVSSSFHLSIRYFRTGMNQHLLIFLIKHCNCMNAFR